MTITPVGTVVSGGGASGSSISFTLAPGAVGNVLSMFLWWDITNSRTVSVATASSGILWTPSAVGRHQFTNVVSGIAKYGQMFYGVAQSVTSRLTTVTWNASANNILMDYQQFHSDRATPVWSEIDGDVIQTASAVTNMPGPTLVAGIGRLYTGFWFTGGTGSAVGTPASYAFVPDGSANVYGYNLNTAGTESPVATQTSGLYDSQALALSDGAPQPAASGPVPFCSGYGGIF